MMIAGPRVILGDSAYGTGEFREHLAGRNKRL